VGGVEVWCRTEHALREEVVALREEALRLYYERGFAVLDEDYEEEMEWEAEEDQEGLLDVSFRAWAALARK
jgi:hypothetical protein